MRRGVRGWDQFPRDVRQHFRYRGANRRAHFVAGAGARELDAEDDEPARRGAERAGQRERLGQAETVAGQETRRRIDVGVGETTYGAWRGAASHRIDENGAVRAGRMRNQSGARAIAAFGGDGAGGKARQVAARAQARDDFPANAVVAERRADAKNAHRAHRRRTPSLRKWVAQEMHGS